MSAEGNQKIGLIKHHLVENRALERISQAVGTEALELCLSIIWVNITPFTLQPSLDLHFLCKSQAHRHLLSLIKSNYYQMPFKLEVISLYCSINLLCNCINYATSFVVTIKTFMLCFALWDSSSAPHQPIVRTEGNKVTFSLTLWAFQYKVLPKSFNEFSKTVIDSVRTFSCHSAILLLTVTSQRVPKLSCSMDAQQNCW